MVAEATVITNSNEVKASFKNASKSLKSKIQRGLAKASAYEISAIKDRTFKGRDVFGSNFVPYSRKSYFFNTAPEGATPKYKTFQGGYAEYRRYKGRQSGFVDLNFTGQMFSSLTSRIVPSKGTLFFRQAQENKKAYYHDEAGAGKTKVRRQFFSISKKEEVNIQKIFEDVIKGIKLWA